VYNYPLNVDSLNLNPVTMEPDFYPDDASDEKTLEFIENYLKPDSFKTAFFACKPNSLFLIAGDKIYSYGEIYLFMDGEYFQIENEFEKSEVTELITMIQNYNEIKNRENVVNRDLYENIKNFIQRMDKEQITDELGPQELEIIEKFVQKDSINKWKESLKAYSSSGQNLNARELDLKNKLEEFGEETGDERD
jgi:hypothetical protein